jgi:hypothetical protein
MRDPPGQGMTGADKAAAPTRMLLAHLNPIRFEVRVLLAQLGAGWPCPEETVTTLRVAGRGACASCGMPDKGLWESVGDEVGGRLCESCWRTRLTQEQQAEWHPASTWGRE